jgi:hypothetical protein
MKFASGTFALLLATDPMHGDQTSTKEGLFVEKFGQSGPGKALGSGKVTAVSHKNHLLYI